MRYRRSQRGQATTELLLCSWVILFFMAAAIQLFRVDRAVFKSITAAHATHFEEAFLHNCFDDTPDCTYDGGAQQTRVEWDPVYMPSVVIPTIGLFRDALGVETIIESDNPKSWSTSCPTLYHCKRTKMAAGTNESLCRTFEEIATLTSGVGDPEVPSGFCSGVDSAVDEIQKAFKF